MISDRSEYWRQRYRKLREKFAAVKNEWRQANAIREKAHDRLRYLRSKQDPSEGEIEQMIELAKKFPKRRIVL